MTISPSRETTATDPPLPRSTYSQSSSYPSETVEGNSPFVHATEPNSVTRSALPSGASTFLCRSPSATLPSLVDLIGHHVGPLPLTPLASHSSSVPTSSPPPLRSPLRTPVFDHRGWQGGSQSVDVRRDAPSSSRITGEPAAFGSSDSGVGPLVGRTAVVNGISGGGVTSLGLKRTRERYQGEEEEEGEEGELTHRPVRHKSGSADALGLDRGSRMFTPQQLWPLSTASEHGPEIL